MTTQRVLIYARISVSLQESVSIQRQLEACEKYASARGWEVLAQYVDDGFSASQFKPEDRPGWKQVLSHPEPFDAVIVWKVDRLARKVLDFLNADRELQKRGAGILAVADPVDMTTPEGRAFATMLSVFAEMEAASISARVAAARSHLIKQGRVVGGGIPYGWTSIPNPDGHGMVLAHDPERIDFVRGMVNRALQGHSVYSIKQWLIQEGAPLPKISQRGRKNTAWAYTTVSRLLHNPVLAGMTAYKPGRGRHGSAHPDHVLRDEDGMPVVDPAIAIISTSDFRRLLKVLDERDTPQSKPRASKANTSPLLATLARCGDCDRTMVRGTSQGRATLYCSGCHQTISRGQLDQHVVGRLLTERGFVPQWDDVEAPIDTTAELKALTEQIEDVTSAMAHDGADVVALVERLQDLKVSRAALRDVVQPAVVCMTSQTVAQVYEAAQDDVARREVLVAHVESMTIVRGRVGRYLDPARVQISWRSIPEGIPLPGGTRSGPRVDGTPEGEGEVGPISIQISQTSRLVLT